MVYRGEDLDLRTPPTGVRPPYDDLQARGRGYAPRSEPIWVDDTVMACCNLAFDLAVTHRAGEVRIEHLVYALTRIDAAAEALEGRGVRVAGLRREMGSIVASEIPVGLPNGKGTPRRSEELEHVLRDAAELAQRRNAPAGIDDLVAALMDGVRDMPALLQLRRHMPARDYDPPARRAEPARPAFTQPAFPQTAYEPRGWSEPAAGSRTDAVQNSRIEALEQAVRSLGSDLASERKAMSNLLHDIQRDVGSRRDEDSRMSGGMIDRLAGIEHALEKRLVDLSRTSAMVGDRIQMLESALAKARSEGGGGMELVALHDRLSGLERGLQAVERALHSAGSVDGSRQLTLLGERLASLERSMQSGTAEATLHWASVGDRLNSLDSALQTRAAGGGSLEVGRLIERFETIEQVVLERASDASSEAARLAERLKVLEDGQAAQKVQALQLNAGLAAEVSKLAAGLAQQPGSDRALTLINERFQAVGAMIERQRSDLAGTIAQPLGERLNAVAGAIETRHVENSRAVGTLSERVAAIERGLTGFVQRIGERASQQDEHLGTIQEALIKLNAQQTAVASGVDQWRQQSAEIGVIANRMAAIERLTQRPVQMVEQLSDKVDAIHRLTAERIEKRNRFIHWLFGTNNWIADSWPGRKPAIQGRAVPQPVPPQPPKSL